MEGIFHAICCARDIEGGKDKGHLFHSSAIPIVDTIVPLSLSNCSDPLNNASASGSFSHKPLLTFVTTSFFRSYFRLCLSSTTFRIKSNLFFKKWILKYIFEEASVMKNVVQRIM